MARRKLVIWEEFGTYGVEAPTGSATGTTIENALLRIWNVQHGNPVLEIRSSHDMGEFLTSLFGDRPEESELANTRNTT